ncbi:hypothetical protein PT2222_40060 [Paraburkholderia tropica]
MADSTKMTALAMNRGHTTRGRRAKGASETTEKTVEDGAARAETGRRGGANTPQKPDGPRRPHELNAYYPLKARHHAARVHL